MQISSMMESLASLGWHLSDRQYHQLHQLYDLVCAANRQINLTRLTDPEEFWEKHIWDSLRGIVPWLAHQQTPLRVLDLGTGGGFPGLPMAIACPQWSVTLVDAKRKKINAVDRITTDLGLPNVTLHWQRAEILGQDPSYREQFDRVCLRGVAAAPICAEYGLPLARLGGQVLLYRGHWLAPEAQALIGAVSLLGGQLERVDPCLTPWSHHQYHYVYLKKVSPCPSTYPRLPGLPQRQPLGKSAQ